MDANQIQVVASVALTSSEPSLACSKDAPKTQKLGKIVALGRFCDRYTSDRRWAHCFISHNPVRDSFGVADHLEGGETSQYKRVCRYKFDRRTGNLRLPAILTQWGALRDVCGAAM